ncbi:NAD(P)/FAD-dependent oxidoreductase [Rehaibacterium terrae]|jgi:gamma-glutamylputrescine oxidase|uniref:Gamma-glutamylputrescine oxidase n=1 Tax=Rehaibacterium terrae TaxID=1341696 RepID=A0A7W7XZ17_9GAMM|nr:FAD-binding oxidoreductase [Rehaibacterium terrae]MBB5014938.1 gamma-glutamylputrescine oxidase [Rehaibacterium terrae]
MAIGNTNYYRASAIGMVEWPALMGRTDAEVCIVGAGFAGLNTALGLAERGYRGITLLESERIAHGASGRNGGFVFAGFSRGEAALLRELGPERARRLHRGTLDAVALIRDRCARYRIACDPTPSGVLWANWFRDADVLRARQRLLAEHYGVHWDWVPQAELRALLLTRRYGDALREREAMHIHPLNYALGLARAASERGVAIHERSPALGLTRDGAGWCVRTAGGEVRARQVVLACGGYLASLRRRVDAGVMPIATYVMVTEPLGTRMREVIRTDAAVYDTRFAFDYYRLLPDTRLLWGGRISILDRPPDAVKRLLYRDMLKVFPQLDGVRIDYAWSGLMSYARHQMPQIGEIEPGLWLAQAFGGHGVAPTTFAGELLAAAIAEGDERWRDFADYGLVSALKPVGLVGAQLTYWWQQFRDAWKDWRERAAG